MVSIFKFLKNNLSDFFKGFLLNFLNILKFFLVSISVQEGIIRHFDHITDLPSSPWYRVPQKGEDYKTFQDKEYTNAKLTV